MPNTDQVDFGDTGTPKIYYNRVGYIRFSWTAAGPYDLLLSSGAGFVEVTTSSTNITSIDTRNTIIGTLPEGEYSLKLKDNGTESHPIRLVVDLSRPDTPPTALIKNIDETPLGEIGNKRNFIIEWDSIEEAVDYRVEQVIGTTITSFISNTNNIEINLSPTLPSNTKVEFRIYSIDQARNESATFLKTEYTLRTVAPNPPSNIILTNANNIVITGDSGGNFSKISFTGSNTPGTITYEIAIKRPSDNDYVVLQTGQSFLEYTNIFSSLSFVENSRVFIRVAAIDVAGNRSEVTREIRYDSVPPSFDIRYLNRSLETPVYQTVAGVTINSTNKDTLEVINANSDIASYEIFRGGTKIPSEGNDGASLQAALRALSTNGTYTVTVFDAAMNSSSIVFDMRVEPPSLPVNRTLNVSANDINLGPGIKATVRVEFNSSVAVNPITGSGNYQLFVNGQPVIQPVNPTPLSNGRILLTYEAETAFYGDLENVYEVRVIDEFGNIARYNLQTNAVIRDKVEPFARILSTQSNSSSITVEIDLVDPTRALTSAGAKAELYNGSVLVDTKLLTPGVNTYTFTGLRDRQANYNIKVVGSFRVDDAPLVNDAVLNPASVGDKYLIDTLRLEPSVLGSIKNVDATSSNVSFDVETIKSINQARFVDVILFAGVGPYSGNPVKSERIDLAASDNTKTTRVEFTGLTSGMNYHIQVREGGYIFATTRFITNLPTPIASYSLVSVEQNQATVNINLSDISSAIAYVFKGNEVISVDPINLLPGANRRIIQGLEPNSTYTIKVLADYLIYSEAPDGSTFDVNVKGDILGEYTFKTAKRLPTGSIPNVLLEVVDNEVLFSVILEDLDAAINRASVVLYDGNTIVDEIPIDRGRSNLKFENLRPDTEYVLSIHVTYDLDDGRGEVSKFGRLTPSPLSTSFVIQTFRTIKAIPSAEFVNVVRTNQSITVTLQPSDPNDAFLAGTVRIFGDQPAALRVENLVRSTFQREVTQSFTFTGLSPDASYRVEVEVDYNLLDGRGTRTYKPVIVTYRTMPNISIDILAVRPSPTQVSVDLDLNDFSGETVLARLYRGEVQVGNSIPVRNGTSTVLFDQLDPSTLYRLLIEYNNGAQLLASRDVQTRALVTLATPRASISIGEVINQITTVTMTLEDADLTVLALADVIICDSESTDCVVETRRISELLAGTQVQLPYQQQTISVVLDYDVQTSTGSLELSSRLINLNQTIEPDPEPEPEPDPEPIVEPTVPREPMDINIGIVVASVVGAVAVGFVGIFFYSFRRFYTG